MTPIVAIQLFVWLIASPALLMMLGSDTPYRWDVAVVFLIFFFATLLAKRSGRKTGLADVSVSRVYIPNLLKFGFLLHCFLYIYVVLDNDLMFRRLGHAYMAEVYSQLDIFSLLTLRLYEVAYYPVLIAMCFSLQVDKGRLLKFSILVWLVTLLFTGALDSRGKLLAPLIFYYIFFIHPGRMHAPMNKAVLLMLGAVFGGGALLVFASRVDNFGDTSDFAMTELFTRTDGLELVSLLAAARTIPFFGTLDPLMFTNFVAMIPFLEIATQLKELGLTSSKNYFLQVILGIDAFDINNSVVTDLYYFGGFIGVALGAMAYAGTLSALDRRIHAGRFWDSRATAALLFAFAINAVRVEYDFFAVVIAILRDFLIIFSCFFFMRFRKTVVPADSASAVGGSRSIDKSGAAPIPVAGGREVLHRTV